MKKFFTFIKRHGFIVGLLLLFLIATMVYLNLQKLPQTNDAFVVAKIRPVSSQVDGFVKKIYVANNQFAKKGTLLYELDSLPLQLALDQTNVNYQKGVLEVQSLQLQQKKYQAIAKEKQLAFQTAQENYQNAKALFEKNAYAKAKLDTLNRLMAIAMAEYNASQFQLQSGEEALQQAKNELRGLQIAINRARLLLSYTKIYALSDGFVSNLNLAAGTYVKAGQPLFAFINSTQWWVQANLKETQLTHVKIGDKVEIKLRLYPNKIFHGIIDHIGWAVQRQKTDSNTFLAEVANENQWFLLPQRFPVMIRIINSHDPKYPLHVGSSATVKVSTGK